MKLKYKDSNLGTPEEVAATSQILTQTTQSQTVPQSVISSSYLRLSGNPESADIHTGCNIAIAQLRAELKEAKEQHTLRFAEQKVTYDNMLGELKKCNEDLKI